MFNSANQSGRLNPAHKITADMHIGDSISVNGACLTVIDFNQTSFTVQVIKGTENKTYLADVKRQSEVNLERAMGGNGRFGWRFCPRSCR